MSGNRVSTQAVDEWFRVEVSDSRGLVVAIETEMLAGRDIGDDERRVIQKAIDHLCGFLGPEPPSSCTWPGCACATDFKVCEQ